MSEAGSHPIPGPTTPKEPASAGTDPKRFGRVDPDGTVYVRTAAGERRVGQVPDVAPTEALAFFANRFAALFVEVDLLARRVESGAVTPDDATHAIRKIRTDLAEARAVGDLDGLADRLSTLEPKISAQRAARKAERAKQAEQTKTAKEEMVAEADRLAAANDWRGGVNRFRTLLDAWKALPRLDRATDDTLWHRFSSARTTYTKRRKAQFAQQAEKREAAKVIKERLIGEAEKLSGSTDWGPTTAGFRDLMQRWKAAGPAPREVEDTLWDTFRGLQDKFFEARQGVQESQDAELKVNSDAKFALLAEWEDKIVPVRDLEASRAAYLTLLDRWAAIGNVAREAIKPLDQRIRALESAIKTADEEKWRRNNPEARARAEDTAAKLRDQIATLIDKAAKAEARGDHRAASKARDDAETYQSWLTQAEAAVTDFGG